MYDESVDGLKALGVAGVRPESGGLKGEN